MDKLSTTMILAVAIALLIAVAIACNQPIEEEMPEPIQTQASITYKVIPIVVIRDEAETASEATVETRPIRLEELTK